LISSVVVQVLNVRSNEISSEDTWSPQEITNEDDIRITEDLERFRKILDIYKNELTNELKQQEQLRPENSKFHDSDVHKFFKSNLPETRQTNQGWEQFLSLLDGVLKPFTILNVPQSTQTQATDSTTTTTTTTTQPSTTKPASSGVASNIAPSVSSNSVVAQNTNLTVQGEIEFPGGTFNVTKISLNSGKIIRDRKTPQFKFSGACKNATMPKSLQTEEISTTEKVTTTTTTTKKLPSRKNPVKPIKKN
jgi:hypothetical protein